MKKNLARALLLPVLVVMGACSRQSSDPAQEIVLTKVVGSFNQPELTRYTDTASDDWIKLQQHLRSGLSNVILVGANDIAEAVRATRVAFTLNQKADVPVHVDPGRPRKKYWLCVFFGIESSTPPYWTVDRVEIAGKVISVRYRRKESGAATRDEQQYFLWAPLGELKPGRYSLQLHDCVKNDLTLRRWVEIKE